MKSIYDILLYLKEHTNVDFSDYRKPMLERRIQNRITKTNCTNIDDYFVHLVSNEEELDNLSDAFTINVSEFFRTPMSYEYMSKVIIPETITKNIKNGNKTLRAWSAGCSYGEEPYSLAILINEIIKNEEFAITTNIFATDIDKVALRHAKMGEYNAKSLENVKFGLLNRHFTKDANIYKISNEIKNMVHFSYYNLLDKRYSVPPDSIFGGFDIVLCQNVLIYFESDAQNTLFSKLYKSLNKNGVLILGDAEVPTNDYKYKFKRENKFCKVYRKIG